MKGQIRPVLLLGIVCAALCVVLAMLCLGGGKKPDPSPAASSSEGTAEAEDNSYTLYCPNAGKADAFLLKSQAGAVLIDTGENPADVLSLLREQEVTRLDALVLSHFDKDHIGGAAAVLEQVEVQTLYRTAFTEDSQPYAALMAALEDSDTEAVTVTDTTKVTAAGAELTLYPPLESSYEKDQDNNASLIAGLEAGGVEMLFTGDALKPRVEEFLEGQYDGTQYQLLKVPHHGGETKPTMLLLEAFVPRYALITSSYDQPENEKLLARLEKAEVEAVLTRNGAVEFTCQDGTIERVS
jgi:beta-lactamase superfamily II metal-dependent hydrolase